MIRSPSKILDYSALLVLVAAALWSVSQTLNPTTTAPVNAESGAMPLSRFSELLAAGHWLGPRDAPAVILVYSTYACGFCGELDRSLTELRRRYPQHLAEVVKHYVEPVRGAELNTALGAECAAAEGEFARYHASAFSMPMAAQDRGGWRRIAESAGLLQDAFETCVLDQRHVSIVESHWSEARNLRIVGTPTLFINGVRIEGAAPLPVLDSIVATVLRR